MPISRSVLRAAGLAVALVTAGVLAPGVAHAAPPDNDDFDTPTVVGSLPFTVEQDTTEATAALDDPGRDCGNNEVSGSVWFRYTPAETGNLRFTTAGSSLDLPVTVYTGERGDLRRANPALGDCLVYRPRSTTLKVTAGTTYHLMVSGGYRVRGGSLKLSMERPAAPANDNFANAQQVTSLPFTGAVPDLAAASIEQDEPFAYGCNASEHAGTVWYRYTPAQTQFVLAEIGSNDSGGPSLAVHEGTSLADLSPIRCKSVPYGSGVVEMTAGKTYYLQYRDNPYRSEIRAAVKLSEAPELGASVYGFGGNFSTYDPVYFEMSVWNDYGTPVTHEWDFGDGTTVPATQMRSQPHRYTADGRYTVTVRSKSADGRTTTSSRPVVIDTHNVDVTKFVVPATAQVGETKPLSVAVRSHDQDERVTLMLYKVYPNGSWSPAGERIVDLPARSKVSTLVQFQYTFTEEDASLGTRKFVVIAQLPADRYDVRQDNNRKYAETLVSRAQSSQGAS